MIRVTIKEIMEREHLNKSQLAEMVGLSISLLSKIDRDNERITLETRKKFKAVFPKYELYNGCILWREKYYEMKAQYDTLLESYIKMQKEAKRVNEAVQRYQDYMTNEFKEYEYKRGYRRNGKQGSSNNKKPRNI